jgi:hypothetical protein
MSTRVHYSLMFSMGYGPIGTAHLRNQSLIILLHIPEWDALSAREQPTISLTKEI